MQPMVRITVVTPEEFWKHGYRVGWNDRDAGRPHLLDDPPNTLADVITLRTRRRRKSRRRRRALSEPQPLGDHL